MSYRHRINFMFDTTDDGGEDPDYEVFQPNIPCDIEERGGRENYRGLQLQAETTHIIRSRFIDGIRKPNLHIEETLNGRQFGIVRITDRRHRQRFVIIEAVERTA